MNYVVTILTEKYLYRVNIEGGIKYTLGSGKKDLFPMSELGIDGQLGMCFNEKKQVLKLTAKTIPLSVKEINEEARLVHICGYPKMEVSFTRDTGEYPESYAIPYECQIHIGKGIYFVYTGVNNTGVPYKLTANVSGAISFMQADRSEYSTLIGQVRDTRLPNRVGNALIKVNQELINFQKAMYEPGENDKEREMALKAEAESMTRAWKGQPALKIPVLPENISVKNMAEFSDSEKGIAVGLDAESIEAVYVKPGETTAMAVTGRVGCGKSTMLQRIGQMVLEVDENTLLYCLDTEKKSLAKLQEKGTAYARLSEVEKVQDVFAQILKELMSRMQRRKEAATEIEKEPWIILLVDDIKECNSLPDDIQMQLHRIMTKTKGYGVLVLCGIRQGDLFNFYTQDQLGVDLKSSGSALALSDTAVHYEGFYKNNFAQGQRNAELEKGFGIFFADNGGRKIKCIDSQEAGR